VTPDPTYTYALSPFWSMLCRIETYFAGINFEWHFPYHHTRRKNLSDTVWEQSNLIYVHTLKAFCVKWYNSIFTIKYSRKIPLCVYMYVPWNWCPKIVKAYVACYSVPDNLKAISSTLFVHLGYFSTTVLFYIAAHFVMMLQHTELSRH